MSADGNPRPLPNARVSVVGSDDEPVYTTGQGKFTLRAPAAASLLIAEAGFAPALVTPDAIGNAGDLQVTLARGGGVAGLVVDELGFPANDVRVHVRWAGAGGAARGDASPGLRSTPPARRCADR